MSEKHKKQNQPALLGGALLLILLTLSNIDMLHDLFLELNLRNLDCWVYAVTMALTLAGLPIYAGSTAARLRSSGTKDRTGWMSVLLALTVTACSCLLLGWLRWQVICRLQGMDVYGGIFLLFSPVLTALASLLISWFCVYVPEEEREADHV